MANFSVKKISVTEFPKEREHYLVDWASMGIDMAILSSSHICEYVSGLEETWKIVLMEDFNKSTLYGYELANMLNDTEKKEYYTLYCNGDLVGFAYDDGKVDDELLYKEYRITYRSEVYVKAKSQQDAYKLLEDVELSAKDKVKDYPFLTDACFVEYMSLEDANDYTSQFEDGTFEKVDGTL